MRLVEIDEGAEIEIGQDVAVAHQHPLVDAICGEADATGGAERLVLDDEPQLHVAEAFVGKVVGEGLGEIAE